MLHPRDRHAIYCPYERFPLQEAASAWDTPVYPPFRPNTVNDHPVRLPSLLRTMPASERRRVRPYASIYSRDPIFDLPATMVFSQPRASTYRCSKPVRSFATRPRSSLVPTSYSHTESIRTPTPASPSSIDTSESFGLMASFMTPADQPRVRSTRYLREIDRRAIIARLDRGEKQSVLAREYCVSRSTVSTLYKQRDLVLARKDENPFALHPKRSN